MTDHPAEAERLLRAVLDDVDRACNRFRAESDLSTLPSGRAAPVGPVLAEALAA